MTRKVLWAVLAVGVLMIAAPFLIGLPTGASGGQDMMDDFRPLMQPDNVEKTAAYYNDVFVPLGEVAPAMSEENVATFEAYLAGMSAMGDDAARLVPELAQATGMTEEQVQVYLAGSFPAMSQMLTALPQMEQDFGGLLGLMSANTDIFAQVPAGLDHYEPLVTTMEGNVGNYDDIDSLPPFTDFVWFFVVPGALLVLLSAFGLLHEHGLLRLGTRSHPASGAPTPA